MSKTILERKQAVVDKLNAFRQIYHHDFEVESGKCKNCKTGSIANLPTDRPLTNLDLMCPVISREEVENFRTWDESGDR